MEEILAGLDEEQRAVATTIGGPVVVLAGAGTGKTRAITHRIAYAVHTGQRPARSGLAVTYTRRAAGELRERLAVLGVPSATARTFHAAALSQLRFFWPQAVGGEFPQVLASKAKLVARSAGGLGMPTTPAMVRDLATEVEWAGAGMLLPAEYPAAAQAAGRPELSSGATTVSHPEVARLISAYNEMKSRMNVLDFEDILLNLVAIMGDRPDITDRIRATYDWFTVDEYQDITALQQRLLQSWLGDRDDVCVVGDPNQTIYSFAGAAPESLQRFVSRWPGATQVRLDRCYRCSPQVVAAANSLAGSGQWGLALRSQQPAGPRPQIVTCADDTEEANMVAGRVSALLAEGVPPRDIAVLMRTNGASEPIEVALAQAAIPYVLRGGAQFFARPEVKEAVVRMRGAAAGPPPAGLGLVEQVQAVLAAMGWSAQGPVGGAAQRDSWESLAAIHDLARQLAAAGSSSLGEVVAELNRRAELSLAPMADGVTVATLHAAKGLEWEHVFIIGLAEGNLPIIHATTDDRVAEELRLLYVGLTRARRGLVLSWALTRAAGGRQRSPSRFLSQLRRCVEAPEGPGGASVIRPESRPAARAKPGRKAPARCRVCGAGLVTGPERTLGRCRRCPASSDDALLEKLHEWRGRTAAARGVPASMVFTDATLAAVAERLPRDGAAMLGIPGIGPTKEVLYGREILELVASAAARRQPTG